MILAFDTSRAHCAVALLSGDTLLASVEEQMAKGQAERLLGLVQDMLTDAGTTLGDLDAIGVGVGPGNFTGIRIGVSAARGLALGLNIPAVGVNSFDALHLGARTPCLCTVDARRDMVFVQGFGTPGFSAPALCPLADLPPDIPRIGAFGRAPALPVAEAIAHLTAARYQGITERPAPLYLRPADAAPARDTPPVIVP